MYNLVIEELKRRIEQIKFYQELQEKNKSSIIYIFPDVAIFKNPKNANISQLKGIKNVGVKKKKNKGF